MRGGLVLIWIFALVTKATSIDVINRVICQYPCQCPVHELKCDVGVSIVKNGCGCCYMCARQHGDLCNIKDVCDTKQNLICNMTAGEVPGVGICKANVSKPCIVDGNTYSDGERFRLNCSSLCTCQNGNFGCINECQDELRVPSDCKRPRLLSVSGQCCKQWTCDLQEEPTRSRSGKGISTRHITNHHRQPMELKAYSMLDSGYSNFYQNTQPSCTANTTEWSQCSKQCDVGVSTRTVTDEKCKEMAEMRLCYIRPCNMEIPVDKEEKCTPTSRVPGKQRLKYEDCISVKAWNLKFCTTCKKRRCCYPRREKTRNLEFQCKGGRRETFPVMWIKSCRCDKRCYIKDATRHRRRKVPKWNN
ncbi:CCN family member 2-like isoform X1 [Ruditapes philippinarum]|uniref:CCN family member 2-like isoform X1 n=1 Tax=Ruditapes philippinarum TaxID=129788 RepID=UPI00295B03F3|nr:CCN family member 2-like isoform X1 [Ruditapes philippinarum]